MDRMVKDRRSFLRGVAAVGGGMMGLGSATLAQGPRRPVGATGPGSNRQLVSYPGDGPDVQTITAPPSGGPPAEVQLPGRVPRPPSRVAVLKGLARTKKGARLLDDVGIDVGSILPQNPPVSDDLGDMTAGDSLARAYAAGVTVYPTEFVAEGDDEYPGPATWHTDCASLSQPYLLEQAVELSGADREVGDVLMYFNIRTPGEPEHTLVYQIQVCYSPLPGHSADFGLFLNGEELDTMDTGRDTVVALVELGGTPPRHDHMLEVFRGSSSRVRFRFNWFSMMAL